ncbi:hypothetical protein BC939DRAFT_444636 [Gamsiella multidivaricata]|uniref:uncharacterized protein n=1 Tax=Gamsiella multidivaricata TaxID=101098 RepID=UPI00221ED251|nr:uncharacterized protein BC939DRAFT_444636 [Gamsiella multidivaricata]KAI7827560.1 hypothetical protein BC939DRAFT_444636 [Gamsiella multidivaricata]
MPSAMKNSLATTLFSAVAALALLSSSTVNAAINCQSPSGSHQAGDSVSMSLGDNGWWPKAGDIYSITATVRCSSGGSQIASMDISNGNSWTIPKSAYGACPGDQLYVEYKGSAYDILHLLHPWPYTATCETLTVTAPPAPPTQPPKPTTTNPPRTTQPADPPPTTQPATQPPTDPTTTPPKVATTNPPPQTTGGPTTTTPSPIYTTTFIIVPTVISGTSTVVSATTIVQINTTPPTSPTTSVDPSQTSATFDPNSTQLPGLPPASGQNQSSKETNVPAAALGAVGAAAALALIVFGLVMTRKHKRMRQEQLDREAFGSGLEKHGYAYGPTMVTSADDLSLPSLHHAGSGAAGAAGAAGAVGVGFYKYEDDEGLSRRTSDRTTGSLGHAVADAANVAASTSASTTLLPFPVPSATSEALKQQYDLANRLSIASQDSIDIGPAGAIAAAAAVNQQLSLKQELDREGDNDVYGINNGNGNGNAADEEEYQHLQTSSPSQGYMSARNSPLTGSATISQTNLTRSSAYETVPSSSVYTSANSPVLSQTSMNSSDIAIPTTSPSDWRQTGSGRPESSHIRNLIRNVLDDDDD